MLVPQPVHRAIEAPLLIGVDERRRDSHRNAGHGTPDDEGTDGRPTDRRVQQSPLASSPELIAVPPGSELVPERSAHPDELKALGEPREPDIVRRRSETRVVEPPLARLDRLPARIQRREVPPFAAPADDPQTAARGVERETSADRKLLDRLVRSQVVVAVDAGRVHVLASSGRADRFVSPDDTRRERRFFAPGDTAAARAGCAGADDVWTLFT